MAKLKIVKDQQFLGAGKRDAILLTLKTEEWAISQGVQTVSRS